MTQKIEILDLPAEILDKILIEAVISRGLRRALRLQLVCSKQFIDDPRTLYTSPT